MICPEAERHFSDYVSELQSIGYPINGLLFPKHTVLEKIESHSSIISPRSLISPRDGGTIRSIIRSALTRVDVPYTNPHQIRHTIAQHYAASHLTEEERLAVEVNFGHEATSTINRYYAKPDTEKRGRLIRNIKLRGNTNLSTASKDDLLAELARRMA